MAEHLPEWYIEEAIPRLKRIEELSSLCSWHKYPLQLTREERKARSEWYRLMTEQSEAEVKAGL